MKKFWVIIVIIIILIIAVFVIVHNKSQTIDSNMTGVKNTTQIQPEVQAPVTTPTSGNSAQLETTNPAAKVPATKPSGKTVSFQVNGGNFYFKPNVMKVKQGDTVNITFTNDEGMHDFKIDEYNVATDRIAGGASTKVSFVASKKGSFVYYCSVGQHRANGMWGTLTVE